MQTYRATRRALPQLVRSNQFSADTLRALKARSEKAAHVEFDAIAADYLLRHDAPELSPEEQQVRAAHRETLYDEAARLYAHFSEQAMAKVTQQESDKVRAVVTGLTPAQRRLFRNHKFEFPNVVALPSTAGSAFSLQELYLRLLYFKRNTANLGAAVKDVYRPANDHRHPPGPEEVLVQALMAAGAHLGHPVLLWEPKTQPYIYGEYQGLMMIDLEQTVLHLRRAAKVAEGVAERGGVVVFVGTREGQKPAVEAAARRLNGYYVAKRWIPGTLTNCGVISGAWGRKEVDLADNETGRRLDELQQKQAIFPDLVVVLNPEENGVCLSECVKARVPTVALVDTDVDPRICTYPIPCNDDSVRAVSMVVGVLSKAAQKGVELRRRQVEEYREWRGEAAEA